MTFEQWYSQYVDKEGDSLHKGCESSMKLAFNVGSDMYQTGMHCIECDFSTNVFDDAVDHVAGHKIESVQDTINAIQSDFGKTILRYAALAFTLGVLGGFLLFCFVFGNF